MLFFFKNDNTTSCRYTDETTPALKVWHPCTSVIINETALLIKSNVLGSMLLHHTFYWYRQTSPGDKRTFLFIACQKHYSDSCSSALLPAKQTVLMKHNSWDRSL